MIMDPVRQAFLGGATYLPKILMASRELQYSLSSEEHYLTSYLSGADLEY